MIDFVGISSTIKTLAVFFSIIILSYAGLVHVTSKDPLTRNEWKEIAKGVLIGISVLFLAPVISTTLSGGGYC